MLACNFGKIQYQLEEIQIFFEETREMKPTIPEDLKRKRFQVLSIKNEPYDSQMIPVIGRPSTSMNDHNKIISSMLE
jgi:hypothetical protein